MENEELVKYLDDLLETSENEEEKKTLEEIKKKLETVELSAIGSHKTAVSTGPWDGPANKTRAKTDQDPGYFAKIYAWRDPDGDPKKKTSYKFIHHEVSADGTPGAANLRGCQTGIAVLNGAREGTTIPKTDRSGVWNHLASHIRDADKTPAKLLEDMTEDEKTKYLQEIEEEVRKEMEKAKIQAYADENQISFEEAEKKLKELAEKDEKKFEEEIKRLEALVAEKDKGVEDKIKALEDKFEKQEAEKKALEDKVKNLTERETNLHKKLHEAEVKSKIKELAGKGIYPAVLEIAEAIMLADGDTVKCFEEDPDNKDQKKTVDKSLEEAVVMMMEAIPKDARIDISEKAKAETEKHKKEPMSYEEIKAEVKKYADEHSMSFEDAELIVMANLEKEGRYPLEASTEE